MGLLPKTVNGHDPFALISALQKSIRRGEERQAMLFALELAESTRSNLTMVLNRLCVIAHEDIGMGSPQAVLFTMETCKIIPQFHGKQGWRMMLGNVIRMLCRARKSREGDHFVICCRTEWDEHGCPEIPDYCYDWHTRKGKKLGRGAEFWITESTKLNPDPGRDQYQDEAEAIWRRKDGGNDGDQSGQTELAFDE